MAVSWDGLHIERLVPVGVEGFADDFGRLGLFTIDGQHGKRVWESCSESAMNDMKEDTEDISFGEAVCSDD
jgi:hypothetical protein